MPTVFSHPAPVLALAAALGSRVVPARLLLFGVFCAVLPDLDVIGFKLGIRYADLLGHRGFSHSLLFALLMGLFGAALAPWLRCSRPAAFGVGLASAASHILLDAMTTAGWVWPRCGLWTRRGIFWTGGPSGSRLSICASFSAGRGWRC